jgi:hypothetical protein
MKSALSGGAYQRRRRHSHHAQGQLPAEDALAVSYSKPAGAIMVGDTNIPIGPWDFQSYDNTHETTNFTESESRGVGSCRISFC